MNPSIAFMAVLTLGAAHGQPLILSADPGEPELLKSDIAVLDLQQSRDDLACSVTPVKPELGFDFLFQAGYKATIPLKEVVGNKNTLTTVVRVRSWAHPDQPIIFGQKAHVPAVENNSGGTAALNGVFQLGEGKYHIDWLIRDAVGRVCARFWDVEAKVNGKDAPLASELTKDLIQPVESTRFREEGPVERHASDRLLNIKVVINFAPQSRETAALRLDHINFIPQSREAAALRPDDLQGLLGILRKIDREPRIGSFSIVACSIPSRTVIYRQQNAPRIYFPALGEALNSLNFAKVDAKQLALNEKEFLAQLITEETKEDHLDALFFVGPKYPAEGNVSRQIAQRLVEVNYPVFYLNYNLDTSSYPWRDAMGHLVKRLKGHEYTISRPLDLFTAWSEVLSRILIARQPAESMALRTN